MTSRRVIARPIGRGKDPLAVYAHLAGGRPDTMMFERPDGATLLLIKASLRLTCRGSIARIEAIGTVALERIKALKSAFADRLEKSGDGSASFRFSRSESPDPAERLNSPSPFDLLRFLSGSRPQGNGDRFAQTCLGVVAFDHVDLLEDLPQQAEDSTGFPDLLFWLAKELIVIEPDGSARAILVQAGRAGEPDPGLEALAQAYERVPALLPSAHAGEPDFTDCDLDDAAYEDMVLAAKAHILAGDVYQIVPSRTFHAPCRNPLAAFAALRAADPTPYRYYVATGDCVIFGCSPEAAVRVDRQDGDGLKLEVKPIAGTRARGKTVDEDDRLEAELRLDAKEIAEHMMLVDLARNDVARVSERGSRRVAELLRVERYSKVMHLVSSVTGRLERHYDAIHALQACLNAGTLSGAPKLRATQLLRTLERDRRGPYGGAVGWLNGCGEMDTSVVIRSALVREGVAHVRAGAGVVHDSDPTAEAEETKRKASALLSVLAGMER